MTNNLCAICGQNEADHSICGAPPNINHISYIIDNGKELLSQNYILKLKEVIRRIEDEQGKNTAVCDHCFKEFNEIYYKLP